MIDFWGIPEWLFHSAMRAIFGGEDFGKLYCLRQDNDSVCQIYVFLSLSCKKNRHFCKPFGADPSARRWGDRGEKPPATRLCAIYSYCFSAINFTVFWAKDSKIWAMMGIFFGGSFFVPCVPIPMSIPIFFSTSSAINPK